MNLEKICEEIIQSDADILMVAMSYRTDFHYRERAGTKSLQTKEAIEKSLADASLRWVTRRSHRTLGEPLYAMAKYEKVKRITVPLGRYGIILCTILPDSDAEKIALKLIKTAKKYSD
ncbi:hypothetical protein [Candidatus Nitrosotalea bavarica]|uniref:hypothetical protein n=1 Tax=Candidatus Nitrosotalea bavarica TaxID=1903277 RepID=UPI000C70708E|nr:hypothetical protein [Candidatus Nitrosotalea bavarica]